MAHGICSVETCEKPVHTRSWCEMHYARWRRTGRLDLAENTSWHRLSDVDIETRTATCAICGVVRIKRRGRHNKPTSGWRCCVASQQWRGARRTKSGHSRDVRDALLKLQGGCCAICQEPCADPCLDHCHATNALRGVLCRNCNLGLGYFRDEPDRLLAAVDYLQRQRAAA